MSKSSLDRSIISMGILGVLISTYALYVEMAADANPQYQAFCDLSPRVSCSKVLTSDFSKGFGIVAKGSVLEVPNCIYGILFYCLMIILTTYDNLTMVRIQFITAVMSMVSCVYLAYLLIFVLQDLCIVEVRVTHPKMAIGYSFIPYYGKGYVEWHKPKNNLVFKSYAKGSTSQPQGDADQQKLVSPNCRSSPQA